MVFVFFSLLIKQLSIGDFRTVGQCAFNNLSLNWIARLLGIRRQISITTRPFEFTYDDISVGLTEHATILNFSSGVIPGDLWSHLLNGDIIDSRCSSLLKYAFDLFPCTTHVGDEIACYIITGYKTAGD